MNELQNFNFEGNDVRTILINNEPFFVGKDVAEVLGYSNTRDALNRHVDEEDKNTVAIHDGNKGNPNQTAISESGIYSLIFSSHLESAKQFKHWVTAEVLPTIRKNGAYQGKPLTATEQLKLIAKSNIELDDRVTNLEDTMRVSGVQEQQLRMAVNKHVMQIIGGKEAPAYSKLGSSVFQQCWHDFKRYFEIPRYGELPRIKFDEGIRYVEAWLPDTETRLEIANQNAQGELFE
ncbi:ORF6C domain-containing protein [Loigolactobacillus coryniformis]|uniref:ORF6C domain-containing protein n=1 Tax=Loigolactobacillus coryniformis TaxID=1610 RepID=UPI003F2252D0